MMALEVIEALATEQGQRARRLELEPHYITFQEEIDGYPPLPFPNIGTYVPKGFEPVDQVFVNKGWTGSGPALSVTQFKAWLEPGFWYAIVEEGQFQAYITKFTTVGKRIAEGGDPCQTN